MRAPTGLAALLLLPLLAGCTFLAGPPLDACTSGLLPEGHEVRVRVVWEHSREAVPGACVQASPTEDPPVSTEVRTDHEGVAVLRLPERTWRFSALLSTGGDGLCAFTTVPEESLLIDGDRTLLLRMDRDRKACV